MNYQQNLPQDKRELRTYLEALNLHNPIELEQRADEIITNVRRVMTPYVEGERGKPLRDYYVPAVRFIELAFEKRDFRKEFPESLDFMIGSIEWE